MFQGSGFGSPAKGSKASIGCPVPCVLDGEVLELRISKSSSMLPLVVGEGLKLVVTPAVEPGIGAGPQGEASAWLETGAPQGSV